MKIYFLIIVLIFANACSKSKSVLICGDHVCINKIEAKQFFEENLTLEVKILNKKNIETFDLVQLNLEMDQENNRKVMIVKKNNTSKKLKKLSKSEIKKIEKNIEKNIEKKKLKTKKLSKKTNNNDIFETKKIKKERKQEFIDQKVINKEIIDVCKIIDNCNIEEISKYLINEGKNKKFPNIRSR